MATPTLVVRNPDGTQDEHPLTDEVLSIGRADENDLVLTAGGVSRRHARIFVREGEVVIEDAGSANGTFVEGQRIARTATLSAGCQIRIGDYELTLKLGGAPAAKKPVRGGAAAGPRPPLPPAGAPPPPGTPATRTLQRQARPRPPGAAPGAAPGAKPPPPPPPPEAGAPAPRAAPPPRPAAASRPKAALPAGDAGPAAIQKRGPTAVAKTSESGLILRGLTGPWANKRFPVEDVTVLGRSPGVQILVDDDSVSRRHAEVFLTDDGAMLRDLDSANGTLLNGEPVSGQVAVLPGDLVQVGVVEFVLEDARMASAPRRRGQRAPGASSGGGRAVVLATVLALALVAVGGAVAFKVLPHPNGQGGDPTGPAAAADTSAQLREYLSQCRSYTTGDMGGDPDWSKAEVACNKALDLEPINPEANTLIKRVKFEQENFDHYQKGEKAMQRLQGEEALDEYSRIKSGSQYYLKVKPKLKDAIQALLKTTADDCKRYWREGEWETALARCEKYMLFACPNMAREDLVPPPGYRVRLTDGRLGRNEWRPKDAMLRLFLQARMRKDPTLPPWECPRNDIVQTDSIVPDLESDVGKALAKLYPEKRIAEPVFLYWKGRPNEAVVLLQKIREDTSKAELHAQANELRKNVSQVASLVKTGETLLQQDATKAFAPFKEALGLDEVLMKELAKDKPSYFRRVVQQEISDAAYRHAKNIADHGDVKQACKIWKQGYDFYKGNVDLSKAILFCSGKAQEAFNAAETCSGLALALDLAVDGDGIKEKVASRKSELKCP